MKINTRVVLMNFKGEPIKTEEKVPLTVGEALSNILLVHKMGGKMKCFVLAEKLFKDKEVEVDDADFSLLKTATEESEAYGSSIVTGQLLRFLATVKPEVSKEEK